MCIDLMKEKRITDLEMQEYLGLPRGAFSNWKRGMGRSYYEHISKIADRLEVTIDYLIRGEEIKTDSLSHQETDLISDFRKVTSEGKKNSCQHQIDNWKLKNGRRGLTSTKIHSFA